MSSIVGGFLGGLIMIKIGINRSLWYFGVIQLLTILGFAALSNQSTILPITSLENRNIAQIEQTSGISDLSEYMLEGEEKESIYLNEISREKLLAS